MTDTLGQDVAGASDRLHNLGRGIREPSWDQTHS